MVLNELNHVKIDDLIVGKKYNITRIDDKKWYVGVYEKIDVTEKYDIDIPISDDENSESNAESDIKFDVLYVWFKNVTYESPNEITNIGDIGIPISKVLLYDFKI